MNEEVESKICTEPGKNPLDCQIRGGIPGSCISSNSLVRIPEQVDSAVFETFAIGISFTFSAYHLAQVLPLKATIKNYVTIFPPKQGF